MNLLSVIVPLCVIIILINNTDQIINGFIAESGTFKYLVALTTTTCQLCSGAIIDEHHVLTAAHCVYGRTNSDVILVAGVTKLGNSGEVFKTVKNIHIHPNFSHGGIRYDADTGKPFFLPPLNDIAVLTIFRGFKLGDRFQKIDLPSKKIDHYIPCIVAGWGAIEMGGPLPNALRFAELVISDSCDCNLEPHASNEFCAYDPWQTSIPTVGDSGGPLDCGGEVVGVNSYGRPHPKYPTVFASVYDHLDFIEQLMYK